MQVFSKVLLFITEKKSLMAIILLIIALGFVVWDVHTTVETGTKEIAFSVEQVDRDVVDLNATMRGDNKDGGVVKNLLVISGDLSQLVGALREQSTNVNDFKTEVKNLCDIITKDSEQRWKVSDSNPDNLFHKPDPIIPEKPVEKIKYTKEGYPVDSITPATTRNIKLDRLQEDLTEILKKHKITSVYVLDHMTNKRQQEFDKDYGAILKRLNEGCYDTGHWYFLWMF